MTADALNTITKPKNTRISVTVNSQPSTLTRFAMGDSFHHRRGDAEKNVGEFREDSVTILVRGGRKRSEVSSFRGQRVHRFLEQAPPVLVVSELVETGAGGRQQHNVSSRSCRGCALHCCFKGF